MKREGWSVEICRDDGTSFLSSWGDGILPPVWAMNQRKYAVRHKLDLIHHGFKAKVVRVAYHDVVMVRERKAGQK